MLQLRRTDTSGSTALSPGIDLSVSSKISTARRSRLPTRRVADSSNGLVDLAARQGEKAGVGAGGHQPIRQLAIGSPVERSR
jgi:hypothetical protein